MWVISFGFWAGDDKVREASYYPYTAPEPPNLRQQPSHPQEAVWADQGSSPAPASLRCRADGHRPQGGTPRLLGERLSGGGRCRRLGPRRAGVILVSAPTRVERAARAVMDSAHGHAACVDPHALADVRSSREARGWTSS